MSEPNDAQTPSAKPAAKRFKRKLTPFLCHEMLYDYATDQLDAERRQAVSEFIENDRESQDILEAIKKGLEYSETLSKTRLNDDVFQNLLDSENVLSLSKKYSSWKEWPDVLRWSITALLTSMIIAGVMAIVPWQRLLNQSRQKTNVVEITQIPVPPPASGAAAEGEAPAIPETSGDEEDDGSNVASNEGSGEESGDDSFEADHADASPPVKAASPGKVAAVAPVVKPGPSLPAQVAKNEAKPQAADPSAEDEVSAGKKEGKPKGFVYRAFMTLSDLDKVGPQIADVIRDLGGEKAGDVELGWKRGTGRYYHFALPDTNEKKIIDRLQVYGPVRISKDPHPRVMPEGKVRFILWVESAN